MQKVLVSGGAGFIGSIVVRHLVKAGYEPVVYDNLSHGHRDALPEGVALIEGDIADSGRLDDLFASHRFQAVLHFAAVIEAGESMRIPELYFRNNSAGTMTLLDAMLRADVKRFVFSSTAALYGNPRRTPIVETDEIAPTNAYGASKQLVEQTLAWMHPLRDLRYASLRYFNAAGAADGVGEAHQPESHLIPLTLQVALGQRPSIQILGTDYDTPDGTCIRDYIHVSDLAAAHVLALQALERESRLIYNLGSGVGYSVREIIETVRRVTGHAIPAIESLRRPGDPAILVASIEKIKAELGWTPRRSALDHIVESAWDWHRTHPEGFASARA